MSTGRPFLVEALITIAWFLAVAGIVGLAGGPLWAQLGFAWVAWSVVVHRGPLSRKP